MQATKQQQIIGYFIEEAKEHLNTIEQGLLSLQETMADSEKLNELFRAAHSVKGGAAMLGFGSIQKVSHHLEDSFKLLKENPVKIDRRLEDLFLHGFDVLKGLTEELQSPYGLQEQDAEKVVQGAEPIFVELQNYLNQLVSGGDSSAGAPKPSAGQAHPDLPNLMNGALKKMLQLFKQGDTAATRQQLATLCARMTQLHTSAEWCQLLQSAQGAIAIPKNSYQALAPLIIREVKQAGDLLIAGKADHIVISKNLLQLCPASSPTNPVPTPPAQPTTRIVEREQPAPDSRSSSGRPRQLTIPLEPKGAARALLEAFDKKQLIELAQFLMHAIQ